MATNVEILTPVGGRFVQGSLYVPQDKDYQGRALAHKDGSPRKNFHIAVAVPKQGEKHWNETDWGVLVYAVGMESFPQLYNAAHFAWKIQDGDSTTPNRTGKVPVNQEGFPGHWVLHFGSSFAPQICNKDGSSYILEKDAVKPGNYIQISGTVRGNNRQDQPGVFLNHRIVAFTAYGEELVIARDPKTVGFGNGQMPAGASVTPVTRGITQPVAVTPQPVMVTPHTAILTPPLPPAPPMKQRVLLGAAQGFSYEKLIESGWTDELLIQQGMMQA